MSETVKSMMGVEDGEEVKPHAIPWGNLPRSEPGVNPPPSPDHRDVTLGDPSSDLPRGCLIQSHLDLFLVRVSRNTFSPTDVSSLCHALTLSFHQLHETHHCLRPDRSTHQRLPSHSQPSRATSSSSSSSTATTTPRTRKPRRKRRTPGTRSLSKSTTTLCSPSSW